MSNAVESVADDTDMSEEDLVEMANELAGTQDESDTTRALVVIRQSQSSRNESMSLKMQRDNLPNIAEELADEVVELDLGVHTGFSIHFKSKDAERIDSNKEVLDEISNVRAGKYDYIVSWDDTRLARDPFFWEWVRSAEHGGAEFIFMEDLPDIDSLEFRVTRVVEQNMKMREIKKSEEALQRRENQGYDQGRPPKGLQFDNQGQYWVPNNEFQDVLDAINMYEQEGASYTDLENEFGWSRATISNVLNDKRELYFEKAEEHGFEPIKS